MHPHVKSERITSHLYKKTTKIGGFFIICFCASIGIPCGVMLSRCNKD